MKHFFDLHSRFFETSVVGTKSGQGKSQRLHRRYEAIIRYPYEIYRDSSVLDIGSHDARWSIAALDAGAKLVTGVEPRQSHVRKAIENAEYYNYGDKVKFLSEDIFKLLPSFKRGQFTVVLCLGIFYHIMDHYRLMRAFRRLRPRAIVLDTLTTGEEEPLIRYKTEDHRGSGATIPTSPAVDAALVGIPSVGYVKLVASHLGFKWEDVDWSNLSIPDFRDCGDYKDGRRRTFLLWPAEFDHWRTVPEKNVG